MIDVDNISTFSDKEFNSMLSRFCQNYKHIEHYLDSLIIKLVIKNEIFTYEKQYQKNILYVYDIENIIILKKLLALNEDIALKEITICSIKDEEENIDLHKFNDYVVASGKYDVNKKSNHKQFEESLSATPSYFVKNARKSVINSLLKTNKRKVFRIKNDNDLININSMKDTITNKYINLQCPICKCQNIKSKKFYITEETIDKVITIEKANHKISFNCLHEEYEVNQGKFFFDPLKYDIEMREYDNRKLQVWTLKNFYYIVRAEMTNEFS